MHSDICSSLNAAGNGFKVGHNYDSLDREISRSYNGTTKFYWTYNADGILVHNTCSADYR